MAIQPNIIFCWFGGKEKPDKVKECIDTWHKYMPDYNYIELNEDNFDVNINKFTRQAYDLKKWAFVSDVARLWGLYAYGGIYMDTDVTVFKPLDQFLKHKVFTGFQELHYPVTATMGAEQGNELIKEMLELYTDREFKLLPRLDMYENNTRLLSDIIGKYIDRDKDEYQECDKIAVYPSETFCRGGYTLHNMLFSWKE